MSRRRRWILTGAIVAFVCLALVLWFVPALVRARAAAVIEERAGLISQVDGGRLRMGGAVLDGVTLDGRYGGLHIRIERLDASVSIWRLLFGGDGAVRELTVETAAIEFELEHEGFRRWLRERRGRREPPPLAAGFAPATPAGAAGAPVGSLPSWLALLAVDATLRARDLRVEAHSGDGATLIGRDMRIDLERRGVARFHLALNGTAEPDGTFRVVADGTSASAAALSGEIEVRALPLSYVVPLLPAVPWHDAGSARIDGALRFAGRATDRVEIDGELRLEGAAVTSAPIAPRPVSGLGFAARGRGAWLRTERRIEVVESTLEREGARLELTGSVGWADDGYLLDLALELPSTPCDLAVGAIPRDLLGEFAGFAWRGTISGRIETFVDSRRLDATRLDIRVADRCRFVTLPDAVDAARLRRLLGGPAERAGAIPWATDSRGRTWTPVAEVSPFLVHAVLAHEDATFFRHGGFATFAIEEALEQNLEAGRFAHGASTITMQLAKNLFLESDKTLARKTQEALLTWWLESALKKREILELYLNIVDFGPHAVGVGDAARRYFGREPAELTPAESAYLACILPAPGRRAEQFARGELDPALRSEMKYLLRQMARTRRIDDEALASGLAEIESFRFYRSADDASLPEPRGAAAPLPLSEG